MRKVLATLAVCLSSGLAVAAVPNNPEVQLGGGNIAPNSKLEISLKRLINDAYYEIHCRGINKNYQKNQVILSMRSANMESIKVNGRDTMGRQFKLPLEDNEIMTFITYIGVTIDDKLVFTNLDQTDPVIIENCYAVPTAG